MFLWRRNPNRLRVASWCLLAAMCTLATIILSSRSSVDARPLSTVRFTSTACRFPVPEGRDVECGDLDVPEDYANPTGSRIRLHVATVKSKSKTPAPDPLVIQYGGPGANTLDRIGKTIERFAEVLVARDIILFDQRGIGYSLPSLNCPELDNFDVMVIDKELSRTEEFERRLAIYGSCRDRLEASGIALHYYSADALAADVASLRQVLGYEEWNLYGVSYGARQALMIMRDYPGGLRSVVLDSVYPVDIDLGKETAYTYAYALDRLFAANETRHPEFERVFFDTVHELDTSPINYPAIIPERYVYPYQSFYGDDLLRLIISIIGRWPQAFPHMPGFVDDINHGRYVDLMELTRPSTGDQLFSEGMNLSVICQDIDPLAQHLQEDGSFPTQPYFHEFAIDDVEQRMALCQLWLQEDWKLIPQAPIATDIPTLILRGEEDVVIPASWDAQVKQDLPHSFHVSFPNVGHGVMKSSACAREVIAAFLLEPAMMPDVACYG